ncbi:MAG: hypothetical protein WHS86_09225 [Desulfosoma sp.]
MRYRAGMWALAVCFIAVGAFSAAHADHRKSSGHGILGELQEHASKGRREDHGNEGTGQAAAWLFAVGNVPVAGTVFLRRVVLKKTAGESKKRAAEWYAWFKKHLMPAHYVLNSVAILTALIHFKLSWCRSTNAPEWALLLLFLVGLMGFSMKFRLLPQPVLLSARWVHTNPMVVAAVFLLLFLGHQALD